MPPANRCLLAASRPRHACLNLRPSAIVSGWFTEPRSRFGTLKIQNRWLFGNYSYGQCMFFVKFWYIVQTDVCAGKTSKVQYYNNPMWPGIFIYLFCPTNRLTVNFFLQTCLCSHSISLQQYVKYWLWYNDIDLLTLTWLIYQSDNFGIFRYKTA